MNGFLKFVVVGLTLGVALAEVDQWAWTRNYDSSIEISCNNSMFDYQAALNITWILPDKNGEGVAKGWSDETRVVSGTKGEIMHVKKVKPSNSGIYVCMLHMPDGTINSIKRGLNLAGPSMADLWLKYQNNVMIGGIAAGSIFAFFVITCLIYKYKYKEPKDSKFGDTGLHAFNSFKGETDSPVYDNPSDVMMDEKTATSNGATGSNETDTKM